MTIWPRSSPRPSTPRAAAPIRNLSCEGRFGALLGVTLWLTGLLVALLTGMLSGYLLATVVFVGSKAYRRLRKTGEGEEQGRLGSGGLG